MSIRINSNIAALNAQRRIGATTSKLEDSFRRLSSGLRITRGSDDAAGLAVSSGISAEARIMGQATRNISDGISALSIAGGALSELRNIATRQLELAEQAANGIYSTAQRQAMHNEANALVDEYNRIVNSTAFNGRSLLDQTFMSVKIQAGSGTNGQIDISIGEILGRPVGDGTFGAQSAYSTGSLAHDHNLGLADFNGDGILDLYDLSTAFNVRLGNGDGTYKSRVSYDAGNAYGNQAWGVSVADINGDSILDFVNTRGSATGNIWTSLGNGNGSFKAVTSLTFAPTNASWIHVGDFNEDGKNDLIVSATNFSTYVFLGNGNGTFASGTSVSDFGSEIVGDFNADGHLDFADFGGGGSSPGLRIVLGNGDGTFKARVSYLLYGVGQFSQLTVGDFNGDGIADFADSLEGTNAVAIFIGNGNGTFRLGTTTTGISGAHGLTSGDLNSDGKDDLAVTSNVAGGGVTILFGNGNGTFLAGASYATGANPRTVVTADANGDGVLDLIVSNYGDNTDGILLGNTFRQSTIENLDLLTQGGALEALTTVAATLGRVTGEIGRLGAYESRLTAAQNVISTTRENYIAAASQILDVDVADEAAQLIKLKILQQAAVAVLAQANQMPALALKLLTDI